ncbi:MAG: nitric oxide synthase oxygenase [Bacteroidetes bacterium]|nr:nitric oxide synthase oxygenase [Bacteroidota bacterium]
MKSPQQLCFDDARSFFEEWQRHPESSPLDSSSILKRLQEIEMEIQATGSYTHRFEELVFGARLAWKNSNRCIGRHLWRSLEVRDHRTLHQHPNREAQIIQALQTHLKDAFRGGKIRSVVSIFAPRIPNQPDEVRMANHQLIRYAGFEAPSGITGDPHSVKQTQHFENVGWSPTNRGHFTPLPWQFYFKELPSQPHDFFASHPELLHEVSISHPTCEAIESLGLKWYALPVLADMALKIGGVVYPFAPFNGFYMGTEIGARNFGDENRYNLLPAIAACFDLDRSSDRSLWKDQALVELNRAILHSFDQAGITIGDHHNLGAQFEAFCVHESNQNREIHGDWTWLNPPLSASQTPQFHRDYDNTVCSHTNFFYQPPIWKKLQLHRASSGCPFHL